MTANQPLSITVVDYHSGGEPFRIVSGGVVVPRGADVGERRLWAAEHLDHVRALLINEPRGHADMYGCFVTPPDDDDGDLGVVFFHNAGYSTACGHGTIALATWAIESGVVAHDPSRRTRQIVIDAPSGRLRATAVVRPDGRCTKVRFVNVPSFVEATDVEVDTGLETVRCDIAFGGAFYAVLPAADVGLRVGPAHVEQAIAVCRRIKDTLNATRPPVHPIDDRLRDIYGVILVDEVEDPATGPLVQRNITVFAEGEVDRSPTGSGTSARLALLTAEGRLARGRILQNRSVVGTVMEGRVLVGAPRIGPHVGVITEITGSAYLCGYGTHVLRADDPLGTGFLLR